MKIWIVRHGETAKNKDHLLQGRSDAPLYRHLRSISDRAGGGKIPGT